MTSVTETIESKEYRIMDQLAKGTFGTVFLCMDKYDKLCCVKSIQIRQNHHSYNHIELIKREVYILRNLRHSRILSLYNHFKTNSFVFIVTEYVANGTLLQLIKTSSDRETTLPTKQILEYFCDILMGLEYLHIKGVVHGDLKPENILIARNGRIKIADFGVSTYVSQPVELNALAHSTPLYTAPEALYDVTKFSFASDVWSLGCVFYELCMLKHPFHRCYSKESLYEMSSRGIYAPIDCKRKNYDTSMLQLSEIMLQPTVYKRASISAIITQPILVMRYYENYFNYDECDDD